MACTRIPRNASTRARSRLALCTLAAGLALALAGCTDSEPRGGVQSPPSTVTAVSPAPPPAPPSAPLPDYTGTPCEVLPAIQNPPTMVGKPVADPAYSALEASGAEAIPCLVMALSDPRPLDHPQMLPGTKTHFSVGDLAFFLLIDFGHVDFARALPPEVAAQLVSRGAFAYFDWIVVPGNRETLQARVREQLATRETAAAVLQAAPLDR